jgi:hypothetical protein
MQAHELNDNNIIVKHYAGSLAYGTNLPTSDVDIRGIFCAPKKYALTPWHNVREITLPDEEDGKVLELTHFMDLYLGANPNILESLWVDDSSLIQTNDEAFNYLLSHREDLLSSKVAFTFSGYASSQLKRIKGHKKWINSPEPVEAPLRSNYIKLVQNFTGAKSFNSNFNMSYLSNTRLVHFGGNIFGAYFSGGDPNALTVDGDFNISIKQLKNEEPKGELQFIIKYNEEEWKFAKERHRGYWEWKKNRNPVRAELEEKFGVDFKHGMHLVRLLKMGEEILKGDGVIVKRPDAEELLSIRNGAWTYNELIKYAESKDKYIREVLYKKTDLRKKPNVNLATKVLMDCQEIMWG